MTQPKDEIPDLPGIDTTAGLAVVRGNAQLYHKLLLKFAQSYVDYEQQFRREQQDVDPNAARRSAHSLKSVAANLGATVLSNHAMQLQQACEQDSSVQVDEKLAQLVAELQRVIGGLRGLLNVTEAE